eukprot:6316270-Alexandrium_andersonii.AAC.1
MSASLVGSEMCIRDSLSASRAKSQCSSSAPPEALAHYWLGAPCLPSTQSRAHSWCKRRSQVRPTAGRA